MASAEGVALLALCVAVGVGRGAATAVAENPTITTAARANERRGARKRLAIQKGPFRSASATSVSECDPFMVPG